MKEEGTSFYWRRILKIDEQEEGVLKNLESPWRTLRPFFFSAFEYFARQLCGLEVFGAENLPSQGPYILAPNHVSFLDYAFAICALPKEIRSKVYPISTQYFWGNPITRAIIQIMSDSCPIDAAGDFFPALRMAVKILKREKVLYLNPEGTRSENGELLPFKIGPAVLALELEVPMVPVYLAGTFEVMPAGAILPKASKVKAYFGKPLEMWFYRSKKETERAYYIYKEITEDLRQRILELKRQAEA